MFDHRLFYIVISAKIYVEACFTSDNFKFIIYPLTACLNKLNFIGNFQFWVSSLKFSNKQHYNKISRQDSYELCEILNVLWISTVRDVILSSICHSACHFSLQMTIGPNTEMITKATKLLYRKKFKDTNATQIRK